MVNFNNQSARRRRAVIKQQVQMALVRACIRGHYGPGGRGREGDLLAAPPTTFSACLTIFQFDDAIPRFSHCFDIEHAFRARPESASSPQEGLVLYDQTEYLHKRLIFMEDELRPLSREDYVDTTFGGPIPSLKDIRLSLREILSPPDPPFPCPAPGCREIFPSLLVRREHFKTSSNPSHLFYKSILHETYCFPCGTEFDSLKFLAMHNQRVHRKTRSGIDTFQRICTSLVVVAQRSTEQPAEDPIQPAKRKCTRHARYTVTFHCAQENPPAHEPPSSSRQSQPELQQLNKLTVGPINDYRPEIQPPADFGTIQRDTPVNGFFQRFLGNIHEDEVVHDLHNFNTDNPNDELVQNLLHFHHNNPMVEGFQYLQPFASPVNGPNQPSIDSQTVSGNRSSKSCSLS
ncbi:hypothetical protein ACJ73_02069 [Blastomyces percursus]|uniref:C2H2-type domain-containing protein n=1 Tax=Blastomyces percursus TaxID=1658174 RepID=A0A1J9QDE5_9EURO|nr:hypothetical protein ACJ73_02069 [Blastomyces percursus]